MGLLFRKSFRITPYFRINVGKTGFNSVSIGGKWVTLNIGRKGIYITGSLSGSGLSYRKCLYRRRTTRKNKLVDHCQ